MNGDKKSGKAIAMAETANKRNETYKKKNERTVFPCFASFLLCRLRFHISSLSMLRYATHTISHAFTHRTFVRNKKWDHALHRHAVNDIPPTLKRNKSLEINVHEQIDNVCTMYVNLPWWHNTTEKVYCTTLDRHDTGNKNKERKKKKKKKTRRRRINTTSTSVCLGLFVAAWCQLRLIKIYAK